MQAAQSSFISSTFWTERIGPSAALKTLEVMEREQSWDTITKTGREIMRIWERLAYKYNLPLETFGLPALIKMRFNSKFNRSYKTLITQEMLKRGYLAANSVYVCTEHTKEILEPYSDTLDSVFGLISECEQGRPVEDFLDGELCHAEFRRLN
jgi:glutamate-1-semialdehyde 2,1-aminomutase